MFRELVHQVLEKIKNESFFKWPNKMVGNPMRHNLILYCQYHQDQGHTLKTVEICGTIWTSWSKKESRNSFCIILVAKGARQVRNLEKMLL